MAGLLPPVVATLVAKTGEFNAQLGRARTEMAETTSSGSKAFTGLASVGKASMLLLGGAAVAVGVESLRMADKFQTAHARLVVALTNTNTSYEAQKKAIDAVVQSGASLGFNQTQIEDSLAVMTRGMGSSSQAIKTLGVVEDLARAKGLDLADAALLVTKASEGQLRPLKALGLDLPFTAAGAAKLAAANTALTHAQEAAVKVHEAQRQAIERLTSVEADYHAGNIKGASGLNQIASAQRAATAAGDRYTVAVDKIHAAQAKVNTVANTGSGIIEALGQKLSGSAAAQAETFKGKVDALKAQMDNLFIRIGLWLIPQLEKLATITLNVVTWMEKHRTIAMALGITIGGLLVTAITAYIITLGIALAATIAAAAPFIAVGAAVAALAAGIIYLWTHWDQVWTWISKHKAYAIVLAVIFPIIPAIFALVAAARYLSEHWAAIWSGIQTAVSDAGAVIGAVVGFFQRLPGQIAGGWATAKDAVVGAWQAIAGAVETGYQAVLGFFERLPGDAVNLLTRLPGMLGRVAVLAMHGFVEALKVQVRFALAVFIGLPGDILEAVGNVRDLLLKTGFDVIRGLWDGAREVWPVVLAWAEALPGKIVAGLADAAKWLLSVGRDAIHGLWNGAVAYFTVFLPWVASIPGKILGAVPGAARWLWTVGLQAIQGLFSGARAAWSSTVGWLSGIPAGIIHAIGNVTSGMYSVGQDVIRGLAAGIGSLVSWLWDQVKGALGGLVDKAKHFLHIGSPSRVFMEIGGFMAEGLGLGWKQGIDKIGALNMPSTAHLTAVKFPALNMAHTGTPASFGVGGAFKPRDSGGNHYHFHGPLVDARGSVGLDVDALGRATYDALKRIGDSGGGLKLKIRS